MTAQVIPFPIVARPRPIEHNPRYRLGVEDFLAAILRERGFPDARAEARRMTTMTLDTLPQDFGVGEV